MTTRSYTGPGGSGTVFGPTGDNASLAATPAAGTNSVDFGIPTPGDIQTRANELANMDGVELTPENAPKVLSLAFSMPSMLGGIAGGMFNRIGGLLGGPQGDALSRLGDRFSNFGSGLPGAGNSSLAGLSNIINRDPAAGSVATGPEQEEGLL